MNTGATKLMTLCLLGIIYSATSHAETKTWMATKLDNLSNCVKNLSLSIDLVGVNDNTSNFSLLCKTQHNNRHILQFTNSNEVELKKGSKLRGTSIGYIYKDYFVGLADDSNNDDRKYRGFMILGAGYGDYIKTQRGTGDEIDIDGLFIMFGGGSEYRFGKKFSISWTIGIATGGVVNDRVGTVNLIYDISR